MQRDSTRQLLNVQGDKNICVFETIRTVSKSEKRSLVAGVTIQVAARKCLHASTFRPRWSLINHQFTNQRQFNYVPHT